MTSCHVSLKPKYGPEIAQPIVIRNAIKNAHGDPTASADLLANLRNHSCIRLPPIVLDKQQEHMYNHVCVHDIGRDMLWSSRKRCLHSCNLDNKSFAISIPQPASLRWLRDLVSLPG